MITGIIQARMGSTRLPGKVNMPLLGKPMLLRELERVTKAKEVDMWMLATSTNTEDDIVEGIAKSAGLKCFRGSEKDVLDRYYGAAKEAGADIIVRITGDCPLHDPEVIDEVVARFQNGGVDYLGQPKNYPEGMDTEIFTFAALEASCKEAELPSEREHVTIFIRNHPERFKLDAWSNGDFDHSTMHWSVDTPADFQFAMKVFEQFGERMFHMHDVIDFMTAHPELLDINKGGTGFEGLAKSLKEDEEWQKNHG